MHLQSALINHSDLIICCLTILSSLCIATHTYLMTKKLKFFESFFLQKTSAYNRFFDSIPKFMATPGGSTEIVSALYNAKLFCSNAALSELTRTTNALITLVQHGSFSNTIEFLSSLEQVSEVLRMDLQNCRKYKFE